MIVKFFSLAAKIVVTSMTKSEKVGSEAYDFIEEVAQAIIKKMGSSCPDDQETVQAELLAAVKTSKSLSPKAKKSIEDFLGRKNQPLPIIAAYVFDYENEVLRSSEIVNRVVERYGRNKASVLPSDYSATKYSPIATLEKVAIGRYRLSSEGKAAWQIRNMFSVDVN